MRFSLNAEPDKLLSVLGLRVGAWGKPVCLDGTMQASVTAEKPVGPHRLFNFSLCLAGLVKPRKWLMIIVGDGNATDAIESSVLENVLGATMTGFFDSECVGIFEVEEDDGDEVLVKLATIIFWLLLFDGDAHFIMDSGNGDFLSVLDGVPEFSFNPSHPKDFDFIARFVDENPTVPTWVSDFLGRD
jgi:hypothetical protein